MSILSVDLTYIFDILINGKRIIQGLYSNSKNGGCGVYFEKEHLLTGVELEIVQKHICWTRTFGWYMLHLSVNGQSLTVNVAYWWWWNYDNDVGKNGCSCFIRQQIMWLWGAEKRDHDAAPLPQERFSQVCLDFLHSDNRGQLFWHQFILIESDSFGICLCIHISLTGKKEGDWDTHSRVAECKLWNQHKNQFKLSVFCPNVFLHNVFLRNVLHTARFVTFSKSQS